MIEALIAMILLGGTVAVIDDSQSRDYYQQTRLHERTKHYMLTKRVHCERLKYGVKACWKVERVK